MTEHTVQPIRPFNAIDTMALRVEFFTEIAEEPTSFLPAWKERKIFSDYTAHSRWENEALILSRGKTDAKGKFIVLQGVQLEKKSFIYLEKDYIRWAKTKRDILATAKDATALYARKKMQSIFFSYTDIFTMSSRYFSDIFKKNIYLPDSFFQYPVFNYNANMEVGNVIDTEGCRTILQYKIKRLKNAEECYSVEIVTDLLIMLSKKNLTLHKFISDTKTEESSILQKMHDYLKFVFVSIVKDDVLEGVGINAMKEVRIWQ